MPEQMEFSEVTEMEFIPGDKDYTELLEGRARRSKDLLEGGVLTQNRPLPCCAQADGSEPR